MPDQEISLTIPENQEDRLPKRSVSNENPFDILRRDFIAECCEHVSRMAATAAQAIHYGDDRLYSVQIDMMRSTMREAMKTYREIEGKDVV